MEPPIIEDCRVNEAVDPDSPIGQTARAWALAVVGEDFPPERSRLLGAWLDADPAAPSRLRTGARAWS